MTEHPVTAEEMARALINVLMIGVIVALTWLLFVDAIAERIKRRITKWMIKRSQKEGEEKDRDEND